MQGIKYAANLDNTLSGPHRTEPTHRSWALGCSNHCNTPQAQPSVTPEPHFSSMGGYIQPHLEESQCDAP